MGVIDVVADEAKDGKQKRRPVACVGDPLPTKCDPDR